MKHQMALPPLLRRQLLRPAWPLADVFKREEIFARYSPKMAHALALDHVAVAGIEKRAYYEPPPAGKSPDQGRWRDSWRDALAHTINQDKLLRRANVLKAFDEEAIRTHADNYARLASQSHTRAHREAFARGCGVEPPAASESDKVACGRLDDPQWWRKQLRVVWRRAAENQMRAMGMVRKHGQAYVSDYAVQAIREQRARGEQFLERYGLTNEHGEQLSLAHVAEHSLTNPALRRGEFMVRLKGFEKLAELTGEISAEFLTLTAPSRFHAQHARGGMNQRWHDAGRPTVRDGQAWLGKMWARARAELGRLGVSRYGFRIAEPHHDGTPHWHMLLFVPTRQLDDLRRVIRDTWLSEYGDEPGAQEFRVEFKSIDTSQGSAVGYLAKYISKNIDGAGTIGDAEDSETGAPISEGIVRVLAWASIHGIRQFQQIGGPTVGLWRELRRLRDPLRENRLEPIRKVVSDEKDWAGYICALAGHASASGQQMRLWPEAVEGLHGVEVLSGRMPTGETVPGPVSVLGGCVLPEPAKRTADIDLARACRRVVSVVQKYGRQIVRTPKVPCFRLAKRQWRKRCGPRVVRIARPARPEEFPAVWLDKTEPRQVDRAERHVLSMTKYGEFPAPRAVGIVAHAPRIAGLDGGFQAARTRLHMWRKQICTTGKTATSQSARDAMNDCQPRHSQNSLRKSDGTFARKGHSESSKCRPFQRENDTRHSGVMNPPRSPALGREAGNPIALNAAGDWSRQAAMPHADVSAEGAGYGGAPWPVSFFLPPIFSDSGLGPVAITVRGSDPRDFSWIATVPYRKTGPPE